MANNIIFDEKVSTYNFYNDILGRFLNIYKHNVDQIPVFDMRKKKRISPSAVPVFFASTFILQ